MYKHPLSGGENALGIIEIYPYKVVRIAKLVNRARFAQVDGDRIILVSWGFYVNHLKLGGTNLSSNGNTKLRIIYTISRCFIPVSLLYSVYRNGKFQL